MPESLHHDRGWRKIVNRQELLARRAAARAAGQRVVQCHGCFDVVHPGHIRHLRFARSLGDILLVSITGDAAMTKGPGRPLFPEELRAENLAALDCVDWVYIEERPTAAELLAEIRPDVYVKGQEYEFNADPRFAAERRAVEAGGGRVVFSSGDVVFSSSAIIQALEHSAEPFQAAVSRLLADADVLATPPGSLISAWRGVRVVIMGEVIRDTYVVCDRPEVAGESPVLTLRPLEQRHYDGGAAIVARHVAAMGACPVLVTALPDDASAEALRQRLAAEGVAVRALTVPQPIAEKQRYLVGAQKVMKLDLVHPLTPDASQQDALVALAADAADDAQAAIITDYGLGLFTRAVLPRVCRALRPRVGVLAGDVSGRRSNLCAMFRMDLLCPSESEAREALAMHDRSLTTVAHHLLTHTRSRAAILTLGPDGLVACDPLPEALPGDGSLASRVRARPVPALSPHAIDALGCGDALLAAATLGLTAGGTLLAAAILGAVAAAVEAQRVGNVPVSAADLRRGVSRLETARLACSSGASSPRWSHDETIFGPPRVPQAGASTAMTRYAGHPTCSPT